MPRISHIFIQLFWKNNRNLRIFHCNYAEVAETIGSSRQIFSSSLADKWECFFGAFLDDAMLWSSLSSIFPASMHFSSNLS